MIYVIYMPILRTPYSLCTQLHLGTEYKLYNGGVSLEYEAQHNMRITHI